LTTGAGVDRLVAVMPHTRRTDQTVEAFGISRHLLAQARIRARDLGMTKSGYFRYAFAKELGYPEAEAREIAMFRSPTLLRKWAVEENTDKPHKGARAATGPTVLSPEARRLAAAAGKAHLPFLQRAPSRPRAAK